MIIKNIIILLLILSIVIILFSTENFETINNTTHQQNILPTDLDEETKKELEWLIIYDIPSNTSLILLQQILKSLKINGTSPDTLLSSIDKKFINRSKYIIQDLLNLQTTLNTQAPNLLTSLFSDDMPDSKNNIQTIMSNINRQPFLTNLANMISTTDSTKKFTKLDTINNYTNILITNVLNSTIPTQSIPQPIIASSQPAIQQQPAIPQPAIPQPAIPQPAIPQPAIPQPQQLKPQKTVKPPTKTGKPQPQKTVKPPTKTGKPQAKPPATTTNKTTSKTTNTKPPASK